MRFNSIPTFKFSRVATPGETRSLKRNRIVKNQDRYNSIQDYFLHPKEQLDYTAQSIFGQGNEFKWYNIADRNIREIVGWNADFDRIRTVKIPSLSEYDV